MKDAKFTAVPSVWNTDVELLEYEGVACYQTDYITGGGTLRFCFDGVMTDAVVCLPPQNNYTTKIAAVQLSFIPICADALAAEWRKL